LKSLQNIKVGKPVDKAGDYVDTLQAFLSVRKGLENIWKPSYDAPLLDELGGHGITSKLGLRWGGINNMWDLLNCYTAVATHAIGGFNGTNINRMVVDKFLEIGAAKQVERVTI
jgi:hypothetical protein